MTAVPDTRQPRVSWLPEELLCFEELDATDSPSEEVRREWVGATAEAPFWMLQRLAVTGCGGGQLLQGRLSPVGVVDLFCTD